MPWGFSKKFVIGPGGRLVRAVSASRLLNCRGSVRGPVLPKAIRLCRDTDETTSPVAYCLAILAVMTPAAWARDCEPGPHLMPPSFFSVSPVRSGETLLPIFSGLGSSDIRPVTYQTGYWQIK